ncbi:MAG: hypothetical protein ACTSX0_03940 [Promethearchaeota archaeon]
MSRNSPNSGDLPEIHCPECQFRLDPQLVQLLLSGKTVYCEQCGFPFHGIESGEVKPLEKKREDAFQQKNLTKEEIQWIEWKKEWQKIKFELKNNFSHLMSEIFHKTSHSSKKEIDATLSHGKNTEKSPENSSKIASKANVIHSTNIFHLKTAEKVLTDLTPFYYTVILLITLFTTLYNQSWFRLIGLLIIEIYIIIYDHREFLYQERNNLVIHAGIPMILFGLVSLGANGIGIFLLARGIISLLIFLDEVKEISKEHPIIHSNPLLQMIWIREIVFSFIPYLFGILITFFIAGLLQKLGFLIFGGRNLGNFLYTLISGGIVIIILYVQIIPILKTEKLQNIPTEKAVILIICGVFTLNLGPGIFFVIMGILILNFQSFRKKTNQKLPEMREIRDLVDILAYPSLFSDDTPSRIIDRSILPKRKSQNISSPLPYKRPSSSRIKRYNAQTGELITPDKPFTSTQFKHPEISLTKPKTSITTNQKTKKKNSEIKQEYIRAVPKEGEISQLIFTVLEPVIRTKLMQLPISKSDKDEISKTFLYLTPKQQEKYLEELQLVNSIVETVNAKYINQIRSLNIPRKQQDFLIKQLNYLPEEELDEFLYVLKKNIQK